MMHFPPLLAHAVHWILLSGVVLCVLLMALQTLSGRELTQLPLLFGSAMLFAVGGGFVFDGSPQGVSLISAVDADQLMRATLRLFGSLFVGAFLGLAFALMLKKVLE